MYLNIGCEKYWKHKFNDVVEESEYVLELAKGYDAPILSHMIYIW